MSLNSRPSLRRGLAVVAPLALVALGLTACNPDHITSMDSPTPSGSHLASTNAPTPHASESEHDSESGEASDSAHASESAHSTDSSGPSESAHSTESSSASAADTSFFEAKSTLSYSVDSVMVDGKPVQAGTFRGLNVSGDASTTEGAKLATVGLCSGAVFTVTGTPEKYTVQAPQPTNSKCATTAAAAEASEIRKAFNGKITVDTEGNKTTLKTADATLTLTATR